MFTPKEREKTALILVIRKNHETNFKKKKTGLNHILILE